LGFLASIILSAGVSAAPVQAQGWTSQASRTTERLEPIAFPGSSMGSAAGANGTSLDRTNGGATNSNALIQTLSSATNQSFWVGRAPTAISVLTLSETSFTTAITAANDIRIRIPAGFDMLWDTLDLSAAIGGSAAWKLSGTVGYEDAGKTLVVDVVVDFWPFESVTIADLSFQDFTAASGPGNLELEVNNDGVVSALDDKTIEILPAGTLTGHVFQDDDGDGTQDVGEPDLGGVDVLITDSQSGSSTVTTDASGDWSATGLPAGFATVDVDEATLPAGAIQTAGTDPDNVTVVAGTSTDAGTDGYQLPGTLTGHIFEDSDGDGTQDVGEPDLAGVDVVITDSQNGSSTVTTDASGDWNATSLPAGSATVDVDAATLPAGAGQTAGTDPDNVTVVGGTSTDAGTDGYQLQGTLTGHVFEDSDGDGTQDVGEPDMAGVDLVVSDSQSGSTTVASDASGNWSAAGLPAGAATVDVDEATLPAGAVQTAGTDPNNVVVAAGASTDAGTDGYQLRGTLTGHVFLDTDGDGTQDVGEPDLAGVDVAITDSQSGSSTVTTDASGDWDAPALPAGLATVDVDEATLPAGAGQTAGTDPDNVTVVRGVTTDAGTDGYQLQGTLTGHVFEDSDGDGTQDVGEPDLADVDVVITDSQSGSRTVTSDASGDWSAADVAHGASTVDVDEATLPAGATQTAGTDPTNVNVLAGMSTAAGSDGYQLQGTLTGHVFEDSDGDGTQDVGEPDIAGVDIVITDSQSGTTTVATDASGDWSATGLPGGAATVDVDEATLPAGATQTAGTDPTNVNVLAGMSTAAGSDGYQLQGTLTGHLFLDRNSNGSQGGSEPDLAGVAVVITDTQSGSQTVTTDANGNWSAPGLPAGAATVDVDEATLPAGAARSHGGRGRGDAAGRCGPDRGHRSGQRHSRSGRELGCGHGRLSATGHADRAHLRGHRR
jgi:hypothetical protein